MTIWDLVLAHSAKRCTDRNINQLAVDSRNDTRDVIPVTYVRAERGPPNSRTQSQLIGMLIALNVLLLSLVIHYSIKV